MKRISKLILIALLVGIFSTCEKFDVNPLTKVETGTVTPTATSLTVNAKIIELSGKGNTEHGFCYATHNEPTIDDHKVNKGIPKVGSFSGSINGLNPNTQYYLRAYCKSAEGVVYGKTVASKTLSGKSALTTTSVTSITVNSAVSGGNITSDGGAPITARGVVWSNLQNPTVENHLGKTTDGTGTGSFTSNLAGLSLYTTYYVRAYAINSVDTSYGNQQTFTTSNGMITLTTTSVTSITATSAVSGGNITSDGGAPITARGVVWSISQDPTVDTNQGKTTDSTGTGSFTSNLTNLQPQTVYYVRAYATNSVGTRYGNQQTFITKDGLPILTTTSVSSITATSATSGGNITSNEGFAITARGVVWSTSQEPTVETFLGKTTDGTGTGVFTSNLTGLSPNTTYYVRAYATNSVGTSYGNEQSFTTLDGLPVLTTSMVSGITATTATCGGNITSDGGFAVTARGVCWGKSPNPTITNAHTTDGTGTGVFISNLTGLSPNTTYYVRAYATNSQGTSYGNEQSFTTLDGLPVLTTSMVSGITATTATCGGNITSDGGFAITARGVCWSISPNPTITDAHTTDGTGTGVFISNLTGLNPNTTYYVRAYATNSVGTSYGNEQIFTTQDGLPILTTNTVSSITETTATCGGNIASDGGFAITARGVCWSISSNPTIADAHTTDGTGTGVFISNLTGLSPNTTYYVRAYATNSVGTSYGEQYSFTTLNTGEVYNPTTGKIWMDRNLGASQVATSSTDVASYGDLYQWGRAADGHQIRTSGTISTLSNSDTPGHGNFIINGSSPYDWRSPQNNSLWQGVSGTNNPCPSGYRLPTVAELDAERLSWSSNNSAGAYASPLKLPVAGIRIPSDGSLDYVGSFGYYWSSTVDGIGSRGLDFNSIDASMSTNFYRADGLSVRCIKD